MTQRWGRCLLYELSLLIFAILSISLKGRERERVLCALVSDQHFDIKDSFIPSSSAWTLVIHSGEAIS